jgi:hypothetical protein
MHDRNSSLQKKSMSILVPSTYLTTILSLLSYFPTKGLANRNKYHYQHALKQVPGHNYKYWELLLFAVA